MVRTGGPTGISFPLHVHGETRFAERKSLQIHPQYIKSDSGKRVLFLYPKPWLSKLIDERPALVREIWKALNSISSESLVAEGRVYGGGLHKMEPKELGNASADGVFESLPELRSRFLLTDSASFLSQPFL